MKLHNIVVALLPLLSNASGQASIITMSPTSQNVPLGQIVAVDLFISDLGLPPNLGAFDLSLNYDLTILAPTLVTFGTFLNLGNDADSFQFFDLSSPGIVYFGEVSFSDSSSLMIHQTASFKLATISFLGVSLGNSAIGGLTGSLSDDFGISLPVEQNIASSIQVLAVVAVPETSITVPWLLTGIFTVASTTYYRRPRRHGQPSSF